MNLNCRYCNRAFKWHNTLQRHEQIDCSKRPKPISERDETVYVVVVNMPGCLPEMEPYAVKGADMAYDCARNELDDGDSLGYSRGEWYSALKAGGASVYLESGYVLEVTPLNSLGLDDEERSAYIEMAS